MAYLLRRHKLGNTSCKAIAAYSRTGIEVFRNDARLPEADMVFRWGCSSEVPSGKIINEAAAIHQVSDKLGFRMALDSQLPDIVPKTWFHTAMGVTFPCIVRRPTHHQGRHLYYCEDVNQLRTAIKKCPAGFYAAEFINKVAEYRVFIVQGRVACVARKYPNANGNHAWNVAQGGRFENVNWKSWPLQAVEASIQSYLLSGLDFGGIDVMTLENGKPYILEINAAPSLTSPYRQSCMAKCFDYVVQNGKALIPLTLEKKGYSRFIHPAVVQDA
jgi:glutathione synthase/RimK-type ligase-like ATP-grasp enzyme